MLTRPRAPFNFYDPRRPVFTRPRFLPGVAVQPLRRGPGGDRRRAATSTARPSRQSIVGIRTRIDRGCRISRSVLLGADFYENDDDAPPFEGDGPQLGIGADSVLDRVIVDKNARIGAGVRLTNEAGVQNADGDGYYIRNGIIIVPKWGVGAGGDGGASTDGAETRI